MLREGCVQACMQSLAVRLLWCKGLPPGVHGSVSAASSTRFAKFSVALLRRASPPPGSRDSDHLVEGDLSFRRDRWELRWIWFRR